MGNWHPLISHARDCLTGRYVQADRAEQHPGRGRYECLDPRCHSDLTVAKSRRGRLHFRHFRSLNSTPCIFRQRTRSQTPHLQAQYVLCALLNDALHRRTPMPYLQFETPTGIQKAIPIVLGAKAVTEWTCPDTGRRTDIAVLDDSDAPVFIVEIVHTNGVNSSKRQDLRHHWWIEISAKEFLEKPSVLNVLAFGNLPYEWEILGRQMGLFDDQNLIGLELPRNVTDIPR